MRRTARKLATILSWSCLSPFSRFAQVLVHVVSALFDINPNMTTHMPVHLWKKCVATLFDILDLLQQHPNITLDEHYDGGDEERTGVWCLHLILCLSLSSHPFTSLNDWWRAHTNPFQR